MNSTNNVLANYSFKESSDLLGIEEESFIRIFTKYINHFEEKFNLLKSLIKNNDYKSTTELAHKLKGASGNLNLSCLSELFRTIELGAKEKKELTYTNELKKINLIYLELKKII